MDATRVSPEEFKLFHWIDRKLYVILVNYLSRDPSECLQIMGLWLWLELGAGFSSIIDTILSLSPNVINELADEAVLCLMCINNQFLFEAMEIPLTGNLVKKNISLQFFLENRLTIYHEVQKLVEVYIVVLSDIMETASHGGFNHRSTHSSTAVPGLRKRPLTVPGPSRSLMTVPSPRESTLIIPGPRQSPITVPGPRQSLKTVPRHSASRTPQLFPDDSLVQHLSSLSIGGDASRSRQNDGPRVNRTMFATFSKGYPVTEAEVRGLLTSIFGECIESFKMQAVDDDEQALYAKIVFLKPSFVQIILGGESVAKFTINRKHVWMRRFVHKAERATLPCGCARVGPSTCLQNQ